MSKPTLFWLGATGYVGSEALLALNKYLPKPDSYHIVALVRSSTPERVAALRKLYSDLDIIKGTLDDSDIITSVAAQADVVINTADSLHPGSVKATLAGLTERAKSHPTPLTPIYVHVSGVSIITDGCNGKNIDKPTEWSDKDFDVTKLSPDAPHMDSELPIAEAGRRNEYPIRTFVFNPALIYGIGAGLQTTTFWVRDWIDRSEKAGHSGTFGEGANALSHVHVHDVASALLTVLKAALDGKVHGGKDNYFVGVSKTEQKAWAKVIGDCMFSKKLIKEAGSRPWSEEITGKEGNEWWKVYGGNQIVHPDRLYALGWEPTETKKQGPIENLSQAVEVALGK